VSFEFWYRYVSSEDEAFVDDFDVILLALFTRWTFPSTLLVVLSSPNLYAMGRAIFALRRAERTRCEAHF